MDKKEEPKEEKKEEQKSETYSASDIVHLDDCKDLLLTKLTNSDIDDFIKELQAELLIRNCTEMRYNNYVTHRNRLKMDFMGKCLNELAELRKTFDKEAVDMRKEHLLDSSEESNSLPEESEEEEVEIPKVVKKAPSKRAPLKKSTKPKPKPKKK